MVFLCKLKLYLKDSSVYHSNIWSFYFNNIILLAISLQLKCYIGMYELGVIR